MLYKRYESRALALFDWLMAVNPRLKFVMQIAVQTTVAAVSAKDNEAKNNIMLLPAVFAEDRITIRLIRYAIKAR